MSLSRIRILAATIAFCIAVTAALAIVAVTQAAGPTTPIKPGAANDAGEGWVNKKLKPKGKTYQSFVSCGAVVVNGKTHKEAWNCAFTQLREKGFCGGAAQIRRDSNGKVYVTRKSVFTCVDPPRMPAGI